MKSKKIIKSLAFVLVLAFAFATLAACTEKPVDDPNKSGSVNNNAPSYTTPLVVAYDTFTQKFSPFFATTSYDQDVASMTQVGCMTTTRSSSIVYNAIEGEDEVYNGTNYNYKGIANLAVKQEGSADAGNLKTVYTIKMRDDIKFSDGVAATIDDVIFNYYVLLDPYYTGSSTLASIDIVGLEAYRYNNSAIAEFDAAAFLADIANQPELQAWVKEHAVKELIMSELDWVKADVMTDERYAAYTTNASGAKDALYAFYGTAEGRVIADQEAGVYNYSDELKAMTEEQVVNALIEEYGYDYKALATAYGDETYLDAKALEGAKLVGGKAASGAGTEVPNVAGIKKIDQYTVEVTTNGYAANAIYQIGSATLTPMHYYGDKALYDYDNNKFGFNNRAENSMELIAKHTTEPMGAGPYKFVEFKNGTVFFEANPYYWQGEPYIKNLQFRETNTGDKITAIATGDADVASDVSGSVKTFEEIAKYNTDTNTSTGNKITSSLVWNLGYGYIGICADTVKVGSEGGSDQSKALRKAIATVLSVYREEVIASYYADAAAVIEYPISSTSWAAPQISDQGYRIAFSKDSTGADIYTSAMNADQKYEAALNAAIGFLKAAGYKWDEAAHKFTAAPDGAKMKYTVTIPAGGIADHPAWNIVTNAGAALKTIGLEIEAKDVSNANDLWNGLEAGTIEMWAAAWGSTIDPDMCQVYHSTQGQSNHYKIKDATLDALIMEARESDDQAFRKATYKDCLDIIIDWAVEVPIYQRKNLVCFSTERVKIDTVTPDITTYWGWASEIQTLELNAK